MAKDATEPDRRTAYRQEQRLWLEIAAPVISEEDKRFGPELR